VRPPPKTAAGSITELFHRINNVRPETQQVLWIAFLEKSTERFTDTMDGTKHEVSPPRFKT